MSREPHLVAAPGFPVRSSGYHGIVCSGPRRQFILTIWAPKLQDHRLRSCVSAPRFGPAISDILLRNHLGNKSSDVVTVQMSQPCQHCSRQWCKMQPKHTSRRLAKKEDGDVVRLGALPVATVPSPRPYAVELGSAEVGSGSVSCGERK